MKAVLLCSPGGPESLEVVELPPVEPASGELVVRAEAIGVGRPDVMMRTGKYKWMPPLPGVIGNELAGTVAAIGAGVDEALLGQRVLVSSRELSVRGGCYAQEVAVPIDAAILLPKQVSARHAVALPNYQLAWALLHDATRGRPPRSVYFNGGGGGVGSAVADLCAQLGIDAIAGASNDAKREFARSRGARIVVDTSRPPAEVVASVLAATDGEGVDLVLDHLCGPAFVSHLGMLARFGLLVSYNALAGPAQGDAFAELRAQAPKATGIMAFNMHAYNGAGMRAERRRLLLKPLEWMAAGLIEPAVQVFPMEDVREVHARLDAADFTGKLVLVP